MKEIKVGENYYYNNGRVKVLKIETDDFLLVCGDNNIHTELNGSNFCTECNVGGIGTPHTHTCNNTDEIIEQILDDISDKDIFWVNKKHLQDKPFEYKKWEKISADNAELSLSVKELKKEKEEIVNNTKEIEKNRDVLLNEIQDLKNATLILEQNIEEKELLKVKIIADKNEVIKLNNSNVKMPIKTLLSYIEDSITLSRLEAGGVDNWEWYGESLPEDEVIENEALEILFSISKK